MRIDIHIDIEEHLQVLTFQQRHVARDDQRRSVTQERQESAKGAHPWDLIGTASNPGRMARIRRGVADEHRLEVQGIGQRQSTAQERFALETKEPFRLAHPRRRAADENAELGSALSCVAH